MGLWDRLHNSPADHAQLEERVRLALLLQERMRDWESADPENVSSPQCFTWGRAFLVEYGVLNPSVAESICEAAYIDIMADKLRVAGAEAALRAVQREEAELSARVSFSPDVIERYVDVIEWRYRSLYDAAMKHGAFTGDVARKLYAKHQPRPR
ncbi:MAG: hypothetical protein KF795_17870 [Labilithrix sp.]|nr:hypothetical protein [Labilithrix sp.]